MGKAVAVAVAMERIVRDAGLGGSPVGVSRSEGRGFFTMGGMDGDVGRLLQRLRAERAVLVRVVQVQGSGPREVGAWMAVFAQGQVGTVGGGHLEWRLLAHARQALAGEVALAARHRVPLGPSLGQCCGGVVHLECALVGPSDVPRLAAELAPRLQPLTLFGGGHVGQALVQALAPLPFAVTWVDSREGIFPADVPPTVRCEHSDPVQRAVADVAPGSVVVVMSFSHAEDLDIVAACLQRQRECGDLRWLGLIGSRSKWTAFGHRLRARGFAEAELAWVRCPIGLAGIRGKQPAVIAASVVAQLLQDCGM